MPPRSKTGNAKRAHSPDPDASEKQARVDDGTTKDSSPPVDDGNGEVVVTSNKLNDSEAIVGAGGSDGDTPVGEGKMSTEGALTDHVAGLVSSTADDGKAVDSPTAVQTTMTSFVINKATPQDENTPPEDRITPKAHYPKNIFKRFAGLVAFENQEESLFGIKLAPFNLEWSTTNVKQSRLIVPGTVTPVRVWILGELSWNGLLEQDDKWPNRAKVAIQPLRESDIVRARQIIGRYSKSKKLVDVNNIISVSAHTDMGSRTRGSSIAEAKPFLKIFDGRTVMTPDYSEMNVLRPKDLMKRDVVLLEASIGRYWDDSENGRVKDWGSTRAFFHLEAVTLLVAGVDEDAADALKVKKTSKKIVF